MSTQLQLLFLFLAVVSQPALGLLGSKKNATVTGQLNCGRNYYADVKVEMWEADTFDRDDKLNTTYSDDRGKFRVFGQTREIRNIEPYVLIYHNCENGRHDVRCQIRDRFDVPKSYQGKVYDLGAVDLSGATKKRKKKCH
ncbi:unnamed protein product [Gongylonema pulchrum]|uniref:Transthyretin-like family protein n=1 Tax=Gongylonema pulchrum TaxID=637853 RepID=A0A183D6T8_9BILA|nr:unnamed protein product [Gongylonema pulchrum]